MNDKQGAEAGVDNNSEVATAEVKEVGGEKANSELDSLKKEIASRDKKINELLEIEKSRKEENAKQELAAKTTEEKLAHYEKEMTDLKRSRAFQSKGLDDAQCLQLISEKDPIKQAELLSDMIVKNVDEAKAKAVEEFKTGQLSKVADVPRIEKKQESAFNDAMRRGAGL